MSDSPCYGGGNKKAFVSAYNQLIAEKKEIIANVELIRKTLCDTETLREEKDRLENEINVLVEMTQNMINENARIAQDQDEYQKSTMGWFRDTMRRKQDTMRWWILLLPETPRMNSWQNSS